MKLKILILIMFAEYVFLFPVIGSLKNSVQKKKLPLDDVTNVVMKTKETSYYLNDRVIVKLNSGVNYNIVNNKLNIPSLDYFFKRYSIAKIERMFPHHNAPLHDDEVDLTKFVVLKFSAPYDVFSVAEEISRLPEVHYAEPWFIYPLNESILYNPNDPNFSNQWGLSKIQAQSAWDISQGDTSVVIGIVDTGIQTDHPDLAANIWNNPGEVGIDQFGNDKRWNGIDDDNNGFVDDWQGWDFVGADYNNHVGDNEPTPTAENNAHGTHVAGIASAVTNNGVGIAGIGFKCRLLPVKTTADNDNRLNGPFIEEGFQGIVYAADMGADIINCSWSGPGASQAEQEWINYVTNKGSLLVCAAGNNNYSNPHYPASYKNVISVAASASNDSKSSYSNFGPTIDVVAPGDGIYSTWYNNTYKYLSGTSMASPLVAGLAALVRSHFPSYTSLQVGEQVRVTCDNINSANPSYINMLGKGRINGYYALTLSRPSLRMTSLTISDSIGGNNNGVIEPNETVFVSTVITNYLAPTTVNASITLVTNDTYIQIIDGNYPIGVVGTLQTANNSSSPFRIQIRNNVPAGHEVLLTLQMTDGVYNDFQSFKVIVNPTFATHSGNNVQVTFTNNGRIGFNDFPSNDQGVGFIYGGNNHLFEGGLIIGTSPTKLINNIRNAGGGQDADFISNQIYKIVSPGNIANEEGFTSFTDASAPTTNKIGLQVNMYSYVFSNVPDNDYIIVRYDIINNSGNDISNLYCGLFFDWDMMPNYATNKTSYDEERQLGYAWDSYSANPIYCGARVLESPAGYRGLINNNNIDLSRSAKWSWLSGGVVTVSNSDDIHFVVSSGPFDIPNGLKKTSAFALIGGRDLLSLQLSSDAAKEKWNYIKSLVGVGENKEQLPYTFSLQQNYPNPFNPRTVIHYYVPMRQHVSLRVYDVFGREIQTLVNGIQEEGDKSIEWNASGLSSGVYYYRLVIGEHTAVKKALLLK